MVARPQYVGAGRIEYYRPRGAFRDLWTATDAELLLEGPAGTGKTRAALERLVYLCDTVPAIRCGIFRQTRTSLNETVLETLENKVLAPVGHPMLTPKSRAHRDKYVNPHNGAQIILGGFDAIEKLFSMELDVAYVAEVIECSQSAVTSLWRALRNPAWGRKQLFMDTNPGPWTAWMNQRCTDIAGSKGRTRRLRTYHKDNPSLTREYLENLDLNTSGEIRDRLFLGLWVAAEGRIIHTFGPDNMLVGDESRGELRTFQRGGRWYVKLPPYAPIGEVVAADTEDEHREQVLDWFGVGIDWGPRHPGSIQLWGVTPDDRHILIEEVYETAMPLEKYAEVVCAWHDRHRLRAVVCDSAGQAEMRMLNERLSRIDRTAGSLCENAPKSREVGIDTMRWYFAKDQGGVPRAFLLDNSLKVADPALVRMTADGAPKPLRLKDELEVWVWRKAEDGKPLKEEPDPICSDYDHACDAARYWLRWAYVRKYGPTTPTRTFAKGTLGHLLGHEEVWRQ